MSIPKYDQLLSDVIAYVYHTEISSPLAYKRARVALLDSLGCAIETLAQSSEARAFIGLVVAGTKVPNGFKLPGRTFALDLVKEAFDLGALILYLDHNDAYPGAEWGHPSDNLGAIIAVADWLSLSYAVGNTTKKPITMKQGLDHTILVKVASTALVAHLMGLSEGQALSALSHAWQDGHPLRTFRQAPNVGPRKGWAAGDACTRAVHLCFLAMARQPGTPSVLTASKWGFQDVLFRGQEIKVPRPYGTFVIEYHFFKLVVAEGHGISAAEAAVELATRLKVVERTVGDIEKMTIRTQQAAKTIIDKTGPLRNPADQDHCVQYIVAVSLMKGSFIDSEDYSDSSPWASDPRVDQLREKMVVVEDEQFTKDYHDHKVRSAAKAVKIDMKTGENIPEVMVEFPIRHPKHAETLDLRKFEANIRQGGFEPGTVDEIINLVENDDIPIHHLIDLFEKDVRYG
ncbi:hypothetical protein TruAng_012229 [Truncatella angustata]|nr:hypothetical protein TruAng_012229 [Truncatella angustata]